MWWWSHRTRASEHDDVAPVRDEPLADPARRPGEPLDAATRARMEQSLGIDLDDVRVHHDSHADALARAANAQAFTTGRDVYFAAGTYAPDSPSGRELLGHELTHVAQQRDGGGGAPGHAHEHEADSVAAHAREGRAAPPISTHAAAGVMQRQPIPGEFKRRPVFETVRVDNFVSGQPALDSDQMTALDAAAERIKSAMVWHSDTHVNVTGHTDAVDTPDNNVALGKKRADAVIDYLVSKGVPRSVMSARSRGKSEMLVDSKTAEPRNRRVDVDISHGRLTALAKAEAETTKDVNLTVTGIPPGGFMRRDLSGAITEKDTAKIKQARDLAKQKGVLDQAGQKVRERAKEAGFGKTVQDIAEGIPKRGAEKGAEQGLEQERRPETGEDALRKQMEEEQE